MLGLLPLPLYGLVGACMLGCRTLWWDELSLRLCPLAPSICTGLALGLSDCPVLICPLTGPDGAIMASAVRSDVTGFYHPDTTPDLYSHTSLEYVLCFLFHWSLSSFSRWA